MGTVLACSKKKRFERDLFILLTFSSLLIITFLFLSSPAFMQQTHSLNGLNTKDNAMIPDTVE